MLVLGSPQRAQLRPQSYTAGSSITTGNSGNPQLQLATEITKETYCEGPDPELFTLRLLLRLSFTNVGGKRLILERGSKSVPVVKISKTAEDAIASQFETTINNYIITNDSKAETVPQAPPLSGFVILDAGQTYDTSAEITIPVPRAEPVTTFINPGSHQLQIGVWTWDESQKEADVRRKAWESAGFLWSESVLSRPMPFTVLPQAKPSDCLCEKPSVGESQAINIASKRMNAKGASGSYRSVVLEQGCEWHVMFLSMVNQSDKPPFTFVIDKKSGKTLVEFR